MSDVEEPVVGSKYYDVFPESDTEGEEFECVEIRKGPWGRSGFMMKRIKDGFIDNYGPYDWRKKGK